MAEPPLRQAADLAGTGTRSVGLRPIKSGGLAEQAAEQLYAAIVEGRLALGERLSEAALAREMEISRGPIREAQRLLERRGLLDFSPRRGFFVRTLSTREIDDLFQLRLVLEAFAVSTAIDRASDSELNQLLEWREHVLSLDGAGVAESGPRAPSLFVEEDLALHRLICILAANESLARIFDVTLTEMRLALSLINVDFRSAHRIVESHGPMIDAILARDRAEACRLLREHLEYSRKRLIEKLQRLEAGRAVPALDERSPAGDRHARVASRGDT